MIGYISPPGFALQRLEHIAHADEKDAFYSHVKRVSPSA
jgi:hypothetical protein